VRDGNARFEVLSPSLIRVEYAADGRFQDRPTMTAVNRRLRTTHFTTRIVRGRRVIRTARLTLRYRLGSGAFRPGNLEILVRVGGRLVAAHPRFKGPPGPPPPPPNPPARTQAPPNADPNPAPRTKGNLGGWARGLDDQEGPIPLQDGVLSRDGWYLIDDSRSVILTGSARGFATRPPRGAEAYQDGYFFGYGHDYPRGLRDLRALSGAAPLLPRRAFGNWYSKYWPYSAADYRALIPRFRAERVPLDVLGIDTDFKAPVATFSALADTVLGRDPKYPYAWNGWNWNTQLFPHPASLIAWLHSHGVAVNLNVHPSIGARDPRWSATQQRSGGLIAGSTSCNYFMADPQDCGVFDWTDPRHDAAYFALHAPLERQGVDFWWLDWCCDESRARASGLTEDTWINRLYANRSRARGSRWPAFARIGASYWSYFGDQEPGAFAEHRQTIHFTGDTAATWEMLDFESRFTASEGNIGLPYVSHDIGSFKGKHLDDDMYVRWVQLGAFQPINRLHSNHGDRLPWEYSGKARRVAAAFLRLRQSLGPYLYTLARRAHDTGLPMVRGMYLRWPERDNAYRFDRQYMLGGQLLVAPVAAPGDPARKTLWLPPGRWVDFFTGRRYRGPRVVTLDVPLGLMPVFARVGGIVPSQPYAAHGPVRPPDPLVITVLGGADGRFRLYEDAGDGLSYLRHAFGFTQIAHDDRGKRGTLVTIGAQRGSFPGQRGRRRWELRLVGVPRPAAVTVDGERLARVAAGARRGWWYDPSTRTVFIRTERLSTSRGARISAL
jgi:glycosyl hydrolase family 31/uncharacterized protein DUF5110